MKCPRLKVKFWTSLICNRGCILAILLCLKLCRNKILVQSNREKLLLLNIYWQHQVHSKALVIKIYINIMDFVWVGWILTFFHTELLFSTSCCALAFGSFAFELQKPSRDIHFKIKALYYPWTHLKLPYDEETQSILCKHKRIDFSKF